MSIKIRLPKKVALILFVLLIAKTNFVSASTEEADQKMTECNFAGYEEGNIKKWDVSAEAADFFSEVINMKNIKGNSYNGKDKMQLTADSGVYNKAQGSVHLENNVVGTSESGAKLVTDSLDWNAKTGVISSVDKVDIKKDNMQTVGIGVVANQNLKTVAFQKDVTVNISRQQDAGLRETVITCDGPLDIDFNKEMAVFNKNVVATDEQGKMFADKMTVFFDTKTKKIIKVVCGGNVKIENKENSAYGEEATYDASGQKAQIVGRPCLIFYSQKKDDDGKSIASPFGN